MLTEEQIQGLNVALNEASLLGLEVSAEDCVADATFSVLTLPESGPAPEDPRVQILFHGVTRLAASLRHGRWDDAKAPVEEFPVERLLEIVQSFGGQPIYGWDFFDAHAGGTVFNSNGSAVGNRRAFSEWADRLSLDYHCSSEPSQHSITLFQDTDDRILEICLWFDHLTIRTPSNDMVKIEDFIAGGQRWWEGNRAGDDRTTGSGIVPLK